MKIEIEINEKEARLIQILIRQGIWGLTIQDVIRRFVDRMLWEIFHKPGGTDAR